jgi:hypothetical protein
LCSEACLAEALLSFWAVHGVIATVMLRDGYARLEGISSKDGARQIFSAILDSPDLPARTPSSISSGQSLTASPSAG